MGIVTRAWVHGKQQEWGQLPLYQLPSPLVWLMDQRGLRRSFVQWEESRRNWLEEIAQQLEDRGLHKAAWKARQEIYESVR